MCPKKCKGNDAVQFDKVHRYVIQQLGELKFKCRWCEKEHLYEDAIKHMKECDNVIKPCVKGCGLGILGKDM